MSQTHSISSLATRSVQGSVVIESDLTGVIRCAAGTVRCLLGVDADSLPGRTLVGLIHPEDLHRLEAAFLSAALHAVDCRVSANQTGWRWAEVSVSIEDDLLVVSLQDVTRAVAAEREAREARAQLQALLAHLPAAVSVRDREGRLISVNPEFARVVGMPPSRCWGGCTTAWIRELTPTRHLAAWQPVRVAGSSGTSR